MFVTSTMLGIEISTGSLVGALANEKTPLRDTAAPTPKRAQKTADRSTVARRRIIIGIVAAVAVLGLLWFLFGRGEDSVIGLPFTSSAPPPEQFEFKTVTPKPEATVAHLDKKKLEKAAKHNVPAIQDVVTEFLQAGYVDPETWGDAGKLDDFFTEEAAKQVEPNIDTLSLGKNASDTIQSVHPLPSKLKVTTLIDGNLDPIRALGEITFKAKATNTDGSTTKITLTGTFFLVPDGDGWKIEAFDLNREEKQHAAKTPSASGASPSTSAAA
jgi:hypothetical protein